MQDAVTIAIEAARREYTPDHSIGREPLKRFFEKVVWVDLWYHDGLVNSRCLVWFASAARSRGGKEYGVFTLSGRMGRSSNIGAHQWLFEFCNGPLKPGLEIDHLCNQTLCVNPLHLEAVTHAVNKFREALRHRGWPIDRPDLLFRWCIKGHPLVGFNIATDSADKTGKIPRCRICKYLSRGSYAAAEKVAILVGTTLSTESGQTFLADDGTELRIAQKRIRAACKKPL